MITKWRAAEIERAALDEAEKRMGKATVYLQGEVKKRLNRSNRSGAAPSRPGEPPRKVSGDLQRSIFATVRRDGKDIAGYVGSNDPKARRLELGYVGRDRAKRLYDQKPRPFLRSTLAESLARIKKILGDK